MTEAVDRLRDVPLELDADSLREKYRQEGLKRANPKKTNQWAELQGDLTHLFDDPYVEPGFTRDAIEEETEVLVIGGGMAGLVAGAALRSQGIDDFRIVEKAGDFGGTWYWNRYPGIQCDIESYIYLPLLEETGYVPKEKYAFGGEIMEHCQRIGRHFHLYERALFQTHVEEMRWAEEERRWLVKTDRGDVLRARYVMIASGPLDRLRLPDVPGIGDFKGRIFHTSRWDYDYTGGDPKGNLTGLADKRVAIVGTGATGVQVVPFVARDAKHLYVVQRTPTYVSFRGNKPTDPEWAASLAPGWQRERAENFFELMEGGTPSVDLIDDGWTDLNRNMRPDKPLDQIAPEDLAESVELGDFRAGAALRNRIDRIVEDKQVAEGLKPWYRVFCKRPTFNDGYFPAFNQPNVDLVDTQGHGLERITEDGFIALGKEYKVDCIIFATGFDVTSELTKRAEFEIHGVGGHTITEHHHDGLRTYHGYYCHGFPNLFIMGISQNGFSPNYTTTVTDQAAHLVSLISELTKRGLTRVEADSEAEEEWQEVIRVKAEPRRPFLSSCTPGDYNGQGDLDRGQLVNVYGGGPQEFIELMKEWRERGDFAGLSVS